MKLSVGLVWAHSLIIEWFIFVHTLYKAHIVSVSVS